MNFKAEIAAGSITQIKYDGECKEYTAESSRYFTAKHLSEEQLTAGKIEENCKYIHGLAIWENEEFIRIYNDPFCSHPVYIFPAQADTLIISTQFNDVYQYAANLSVDHCGIYELLWLGCMLYDRTIYKEVKQLPSASYCEIEKNTMKYKINIYWNFEIFENKKIDSQQKADDLVYQKLKEIFGVYRNKHLLMGLSGGLDSRLAACMLSDNLDKDQLEFFTFGYNEHILEYTFAKKTAKRLNLRRPVFIKLAYEDYRNSKSLSVKTGCHVGMQHGHTYESLKRINTDKDAIFISNYYSDAVMGWDARKEKIFEKFEDLELYKEIHRNKDKMPPPIATGVSEEALHDLKNVFDRYNTKSNFSCFEEFFYVTEKNAKFHLRSAYQCNDIMRSDIPFADFELLNLCISTPLEYRWEKKLEKEIISKHYFDEKDISSRRYFGRSRDGEEEYSFKEKLYYISGAGLLRGLNLLNIILAKISNSRIQVINPYQTENQRIVFDRYFKDEFLEALENLKKLDIISEHEYERLAGKQFKSDTVALKFTMIGVWDNICQSMKE